jgi:hypothetical protein
MPLPEPVMRIERSPSFLAEGFSEAGMEAGSSGGMRFLMRGDRSPVDIDAEAGSIR